MKRLKLAMAAVLMTPPAAAAVVASRPAGAPAATDEAEARAMVSSGLAAEGYSLITSQLNTADTGAFPDDGPADRAHTIDVGSYGYRDTSRRTSSS